MKTEEQELLRAGEEIYNALSNLCQINRWEHKIFCPLDLRVCTIKEKGMIRIPIVENFNPLREIGYMEIDETKLPERTDFCFSPGWEIGKGRNDLICVSLILDGNYLKYLQKEMPLATSQVVQDTSEIIKTD